MHAVNKREEEMALAENFHKLQQAHEYLKGERKQVARERDSYKKKYEKLKTQSQKEAELAAGRIATLQVKVPVLERENAELKEQNVKLGDKVTELALMETEAWSKAVNQFLESSDYQQRLKEEREAFMRRKVQEWADAEWLDVDKMMVEATEKAEAEKAKLAAQAAQPTQATTQATPSSPEAAGGGDEATAEEEEEEEPLIRRREEAAAEVAGDEEEMAADGQEVQSREEGTDANALD